MLRHFRHLNGRSFVSAQNRGALASSTPPPASRKNDGDPAQPNERQNLRDLSCLLRCSLLLNARLQKEHLYFFSGASDDLRFGVDPAADDGVAVAAAAGMVRSNDKY